MHEGPSPQRKKRPHNLFKLFGRGGGNPTGTVYDEENMGPSMFNMSQDSMASQSQFSQFSQDFTDRFQQCNMTALPMENMHSLACAEDSMIDGNGNDSDTGNNTSTSGLGVGGNGTRLTQQSFNDSDSQSIYDSQPTTEPQLPQPPSSSSNSRVKRLSLEIPPPSAPQEGFFVNGTSLTSTGTPLSATNAINSAGSGSCYGGSFFNFTGSSNNINKSGSSNMPPPQQQQPNSKGSTGSTSERERLVNLPSPMENPFLGHQNSFDAAQHSQGSVISPYTTNNEKPIPSRKSSRRPPQSVYIGAFKERPRYICDFEQQQLLGEGTHSSVYLTRRRLDGRSYAVKRLKRKISGEKEGALLVREAMACAALQGCPNLVQYFGCWLDDNYLCIQTEACAYGSMDSLVGSLLPTLNDLRELKALRFEKLSSDSINTDVDVGVDVDEDSQMTLYPPSPPSHQHQEFLYSCSQEQGTSQDADVTSDVDGDESMRVGGSMDTFSDDPDADADPYVQSDGVRVGISEELAWQTLRDISLALSYMHKKGIAHLDMRPANIFITRSAWEGSIGENQHQDISVDVTNPNPTQLQNLILQGRAVLKLGDLGQACPLGETLLNEGESRYLPREVLNESKNIDLAKSDIFSFGASVYELLLGRELASESTEWHELRDGIFCTIVEKRYSSNLLQLLHNMMHVQPINRPTAEIVFVQAGQCQCRDRCNSHPQLSNGSVDNLENMKMAEMNRLREENEHLRAMLSSKQFS